MKKTCLDAFNPIHVGTKRANQFDKSLFYETFVTNDKIVLTNDHFLDCIELSENELSTLFRLLEKDELSIFYDHVPLRYIKHPENNVMIEIELNESVNLDHFFVDERYSSLNRKYRRIIDKKIQTLDHKLIDINSLCDFVCSILNDKELLKEIYKSTKPYHILSDNLQFYEYKITAKDGVFFIESDVSDSKGISGVLVGEFLTTIIRTYINILSQRVTNADNLILSNSNRTIFEKLFNDAVDRSTERLNELLLIENMPDLANYFSMIDIEIKDVFELRNKSRSIRKFINETEYTTSIEFYKEYRDRIDKQYKIFDGVTYKTLRLILTSIIAPLGTALDISELIGFSDRAINKIKPTVRLQDIFKVQ